VNAIDVSWIWNRRGRPVLEFKIDGHPACIHSSSQKTELTWRGIVFLVSERSAQRPSI
jgi:hypothetical protein